ncbi:hypothetical protein D3C78_1121140 [compost metagenome]
MDAQRFLVAGGFAYRLFCPGVRRLGNQQVIDVGGAIIVDHEARVGLEQVDLVDRQAVPMLIVQAFDHDLLPLEEVAGFQGVQGMQLIDLGAAGDVERQGLGAFQVDRQIAAEHAAAQFQANERRDVGLGNPQVDVLGLYLQPGADRGQVDLAVGHDLALLAHAGIELEGKGRTVEAVEVLQVEVQRSQIQGDGRLCLSVSQMHLVIAQLYVLEQHLPGFAWGGRFGLR